MKGFGTDEDKIIEVLTSCSNQQRQQLVKFFEQELERVNLHSMCKYISHYEYFILIMLNYNRT